MGPACLTSSANTPTRTGSVVNGLELLVCEATHGICGDFRERGHLEAECEGTYHGSVKKQLVGDGRALYFGSISHNERRLYWPQRIEPHARSSQALWGIPVTN